MKIDIPQKLQFLFKPKRYKIMFGGRGGYKTYSTATALACYAASEQKNILCAREIQKSIDASVHDTMKTVIKSNQMTGLFRVLDTRIESTQGSKIRYTGLYRNVENIKSSDSIDICWIEEAESVSEDSWDTLIPTIRKPGSEIWITFNPKDEFSFVWKLVKPHIDEIREKGFYEDEEKYIVKTFLEENPFASEELLNESRKLRESNYKKWLHIYGGEVYSDYTDSIIQPEWFDAAIDAHEKLGWKALGVKSTGFDIADTGDAKAVYTRHGSVIINSERWITGELPEAIDNAFEHTDATDSEYMVYDATGMGASMKVYQDKVNVAGKIELEPFWDAGAVDNPEQLYGDDPALSHEQRKKLKTNKETFKNKRSQYYIYLADRFQTTYNAIEKGIYTDPEKMISLSSELPNIDILKSELIKVKKVRGNNTFIQIQSKKDAMKEGIKSPNDADALKMCFANPPVDSGVAIDIDYDSEF